MILRTVVATTLAFLFASSPTTANALEASPLKERSGPNLSQGPCALAVSTNGTAANYRWYNVCSGYIWIYSDLSDGESNGVLYGGPLLPAVNDANTVKRAITYWRNVAPGYAQTVDVILDADVEGDGCPDAVLASDLDLDPGLRWNCSEFNAPIPTGITHVIVRTVHHGGAAAAWATDGPFTATCSPNSTPRSFYYGINGSACAPWVGPDGLADNFLGWLIVDGTPGPPAPVACCFPNGSCQDLTPDTCSDAGGAPASIGTSCANFVCPPPPPPPGSRACCFADGSCSNLLASDCVAAGGTPRGPGTTCANTICAGAVPIACCFADGTCADLPPTACAAAGGAPQGSGSNCASASCPNTEACCMSNGACADITASACAAAGGASQGANTACATAACPAAEACCLPDETCAERTPAVCVSQGGTPQGPGSTCATVACPTLPRGACCLPGGICVADIFAFDCNQAGGTWYPNTPCDPTLCIANSVESKTWGQIKGLFR